MADRLAGPDLRLVPATAVVWFTIWWATGQSAGNVARALGLAIVLATVAVAGLLRSGHWRAWWPALAMVAVLVVLELAGICLRLGRREADPLLAWAQQHRTVTVTGQVTADPAPISSRFPGAGQRWALQLSIRSADAGPQSGARRGRAVVAVIGPPAYADLVAGQHIQVRGKLAPGDPGDKALVIMSPRAGPVALSDGGWIWRAADQLRAGLREACSGLPLDAGGLLPALVVGDTSRLPQTLADDLQAAGLTHLTAVSGANLVIVATAISGLCAAAGLRTRVRVAAAAVSIAGFVVLARPEPSVLRAAVMAGLGLIAVLNSRPGRGISLLSATALILLLVDPWLARSFGFILSVLATAGLLLLVPAWLAKAAGRAHRHPPVWRQILVALVAVPVAALIATAPITVLLQPQISAVSVPANLLAEPAVAVATLLGVLAALLSPWWPGGAAAAAHVGGLGTGWIAEVAHRGAVVPGAQLPWLPGAAGAVVLAALLLVVVVLSLRPARGPMHPARRPRLVPPGFLDRLQHWFRHRLTSGEKVLAGAMAAILVVAGGLAARAGLVPVPGIGPGVPDDWLVVQCDVGQGSATLLNTGPGRAIMVDTGPDPALAARCLRQQHVRALDLVVITHFHADHAGGLTGVLPRAGHPPILVSPFARPAEQAASVLATARGAGSMVVTGHAGLTGDTGAGPAAGGKVHWQLLYPSLDEATRLHATSLSPAASAQDDGTQINDASLALVVTLRGVRVLLLGDLEEDAQQVLLDSGAVEPVDVVVVAHHGSARQYPPLYRRADPRVALIGVGADNDYGHPAPSAMSMLDQLGVRILRTDTGGQLTVAGDSQHLRVLTGH